MCVEKKRGNIYFVQLITISRAIIAFIFVSIGLRPEYRVIASILYIYACLSDLLDGFLARRLSCTSLAGKTLDLFSDKYLTIISVLYATARGISVIPCGIIILKEVFLITMRTIKHDNNAILPPQRLLGGITVFPIWCTTFLLLQYPFILEDSWYLFEISYWCASIICLLNLSQKIWRNWRKILKAFME